MKNNAHSESSLALQELYKQLLVAESQDATGEKGVTHEQMMKRLELLLSNPKNDR